MMSSLLGLFLAVTVSQPFLVLVVVVVVVFVFRFFVFFVFF